MTPVKNRLRRLALGTVATLVALVPAVPASALTFTNGFACTVTPIRPTLSSTSALAQFTVSCAKAATVTVEVSIIEWDGTKYQTTTSTTIALAATKIPVAATTTPQTFSSVAKPCWNTETGGEEYGTQVRILIGTKWSAYERTPAPATDAYLC